MFGTGAGLRAYEGVRGNNRNGYFTQELLSVIETRGHCTAVGAVVKDLRDRMTERMGRYGQAADMNGTGTTVLVPVVGTCVIGGGPCVVEDVVIPLAAVSAKQARSVRSYSITFYYFGFTSGFLIILVADARA